MRTSDVISSLQQRGVTLKVVAGSLRIAGADKLTDREKAALKAHKGAILRALEPPPTGPTATASQAPVTPSSAATEHLPNRTEPPEPGSTAPFGQRELDAINAGCGCWVWSAVLEAWLFWVRDEERRRLAIGKGIDAWRIWTLPELAGVVGFESQDLMNIAAIRRQFNGTITPSEGANFEPGEGRA